METSKEHYFTVNRDGKKVVFTKGNLQIKRRPFEWRIAEHQYDVLDTDSKWEDLVEFRYTKKNYRSFRVLTNEEWVYIIETRENARNKWGLASLADLNGIILLPDNWVSPASCDFTAGYSYEYETNVYTIEEWELMQKAGAIFLPAAGFCCLASNDQVNKYGYYWSSAPASMLRYSANNSGYTFGFGKDLVKESREWGLSQQSIRLVQDID